MKTLVLCNHKGGVGKSAVATLLAHHLAGQSRRVLVVDLDHQGNTSGALRRSGRLTAAGFDASALFAGRPLSLPDAAFTLIAADDALLSLERQREQHTIFARSLRVFLAQADAHFDVCIVDTNPNPDIRVIAALVSADFVLSPIQLNQEAMDGVSALLNHGRVGLRKIRAALNPRLSLIGLLPTLVESNPHQRANFLQVVQRYHPLMIRIGDGPGDFAAIPRRSCIAEAQAEGQVLWEMKKTAARDTWREIERGITHIARIVNGEAAIRSAAQETARGAAA